jgi:hypothetical protein
MATFVLNTTPYTIESDALGHQSSSGGGIHGGIINGTMGMMAGGRRHNILSMCGGCVGLSNIDDIRDSGR